MSDPGGRTKELARELMFADRDKWESIIDRALIREREEALGEAEIICLSRARENKTDPIPTERPARGDFTGNSDDDFLAGSLRAAWDCAAAIRDRREGSGPSLLGALDALQKLHDVVANEQDMDACSSQLMDAMVKADEVLQKGVAV